jgi:hypothetical protein
MSNPMIRIHNTETNEIIDREMTDEEFEIWQIAQAEEELLKAEALSKQALKDSALAKLQDLGLTEDEAKAFLG